ncbi:23S rRNA pseudouridine2604 synthase [Arcicella aurantiaca]|uniref:Pseudouridine synthase n=1 Tax=Arcicella aurantiaca TaxID=591202 RepID=A0A316EKH2_9BACT|nr:pseudouridine synthase [Arcicella aurantiaca]PWK29412.1 23S rRNA pseudouridine2604 synthase [Arcicella aurantiaca]
MTFRKRLQYLLVKRLRISNKNALTLINEGKVLVNNAEVFENVVINPEDSVVFEEQILQEGKTFLYVAFYKPRGIETTLNLEIEDNLKAILPFKEELFPVGRLDKESEGLLVLTNDGRLFDKTLRSEHQTEKEYLVIVDKIIDEDFVQKMSAGITILGKKTLPCRVEKIDDFTFKIILIQGINRQIRRMCYKLDYGVLKLVRVRIGEVELKDLAPNGFRYFK